MPFFFLVVVGVGETAEEGGAAQAAAVGERRGRPFGATAKHTGVATGSDENTGHERPPVSSITTSNNACTVVRLVGNGEQPVFFLFASPTNETDRALFCPHAPVLGYGVCMSIDRWWAHTLMFVACVSAFVLWFLFGIKIIL